MVLHASNITVSARLKGCRSDDQETADVAAGNDDGSAVVDLRTHRTRSHRVRPCGSRLAGDPWPAASLYLRRLRGAFATIGCRTVQCRSWNGCGGRPLAWNNHRHLEAYF